MFSFPISRLCPLVGGNARFVQEDIVLSGYKVPAGVGAISVFCIVVMCLYSISTYHNMLSLFYMQSLVISANLITGRLPHIFPEPERFMPERWSRENKETPHAFSSLSFGFGPRMCVGQFHSYTIHVMQSVDKPPGYSLSLLS